MKICVVGSCGSKKATSHEEQPSCMELGSREEIQYWSTQFADSQRPAREMYTGNQSRELIRGVDLLREIQGVSVKFYVVSAGFGLLQEGDSIPPYDCSFSGMKKSEIIARSEMLSIPRDFIALCSEDFDLMYLALGREYLRALGSEWWTHCNQNTICFSKINLKKNIIALPAHSQTVRSFSDNALVIAL